jgi:hypothetical protein
MVHFQQMKFWMREGVGSSLADLPQMRRGWKALDPKPTWKEASEASEMSFVQNWALSEVAECIICGFKGGTSRPFSGNLWRIV